MSYVTLDEAKVLRSIGYPHLTNRAYHLVREKWQEESYLSSIVAIRYDDYLPMPEYSDVWYFLEVNNLVSLTVVLGIPYATLRYRTDGGWHDMQMTVKASSPFGDAVEQSVKFIINEYKEGRGYHGLLHL